MLEVSSAVVVLALAEGSFIFLAALIAGFFAIVFGYYTILGSGINKHPNDGLDGAPGSSGPSEASGMGRNPGNTREDHSVGDTFSTHGTQWRDPIIISPGTTPLTGEPLLAAVTDAMVALHERYHHRAPVTAKTLLLGDDLLACVMGGVYTDVEKTMIELQRTTIVQETRSEFQMATQDRFIDAVERLSGREVLAFISNQHVGPDIEIELFMLRTPAE